MADGTLPMFEIHGTRPSQPGLSDIAIAVGVIGMIVVMIAFVGIAWFIYVTPQGWSITISREKKMDPVDDSASMGSKKAGAGNGNSASSWSSAGTTGGGSYGGHASDARYANSAWIDDPADFAVDIESNQRFMDAIQQAKRPTPRLNGRWP